MQKKILTMSLLINRDGIMSGIHRRFLTYSAISGLMGLSLGIAPIVHGADHGDRL